MPTATLIANATWVDGPVAGKYAIRMTPVSPGWIELGTYPTAFDGGAFTVFVYFQRIGQYLHSLSSSLFQILDGGGYATIGLDLTGDIEATGIAWTLQETGSTGNAIGRNATIAMTNNSWHTIAATYNGNRKDSGCKIYFDGVRVDSVNLNSSAYTLTDFGNPSGQLTCGRHFFWGDIAQVRVYSKALSAAAIAKLHANPYNPAP